MPLGMFLVQYKGRKQKGNYKMTTVVQVQNLTKRFKSQNGVPAVGNVDLEISKGELFGLVGPDGAGKTTTLRMLATVMLPTSGQAVVAGFNTSSEAEKCVRLLDICHRTSLYTQI